MTNQEFIQLSLDLVKLSKLIPLRWGGVQNDSTDSKINLFKVTSFADLENIISQFKDSEKNYLRRRWFLWKCSVCDEHIFCVNDSVIPNPDTRDKKYDIEFNNDANLRFDIKGTIIPRQFRENVDGVLRHPQEMIRFFYEQQSKGVRYGLQNRIFIIHHSFLDATREMILRCSWDNKIDIYSSYTEFLINQNQLGKVLTINIGNKILKVGIIFIFENKDRTISYLFL